MNGINLDFSGVPGADNNPSFDIRFVRLYASEQGFQAPGGGVYTGGMIVFDNAILSGTPIIPEPSTSVLLLAALCLGVCWKRTQRV